MSTLHQSKKRTKGRLHGPGNYFQTNQQLLIVFARSFSFPKPASTLMELDPAARFGHSGVNKGKGEEYSKGSDKGHEKFSKGGAKGGKGGSSARSAEVVQQAMQAWVDEAERYGEANFYWIPGKASPASIFTEEGNGAQHCCSLRDFMAKPREEMCSLAAAAA